MEQKEKPVDINLTPRTLPELKSACEYLEKQSDKYKLNITQIISKFFLDASNQDDDTKQQKLKECFDYLGQHIQLKSNIAVLKENIQLFEKIAPEEKPNVKEMDIIDENNNDIKGDNKNNINSK